MTEVAFDFLSETDPRTLVVYGLVSDPSVVLQQLIDQDSSRAEPLSNRFAVLPPSLPSLRLGSPGWIDITAQELADAGGPARLFALCRGKITNRAAQFSLLPKKMLNLYFDFVDAEIDANRAQLDDRDALFKAEDWRLTAWLPLPQAWVLLPPAFGAEATFAGLDAVFWLADKLIGVRIEDGATLVKSVRHRLEFLEEQHPHLSLVRIPKSRLEEERFPIDLFPAEFADFWSDVQLPTGPFQQAVLRQNLVMQAG